MATGSKGTRLSAIAKRLAREADQDYELVASILWRYSRGDYAEGAPVLGLQKLLSSTAAPISTTSITTLSISTPTGKTFSVNMKEPEHADFLIDDIVNILKVGDPLIPYLGLIKFFADQSIPAPHWLDPSAKPSSLPRLTPGQLRKANTQKKYDGWQANLEKLASSRPGRSKSDYATMISKLDIGAGASPRTIANKIKLIK